MITATVKTTRTKILGILCVILAVIIGIILFFFGGSSKNAEEGDFGKIKDNNSRTAYLSSKGTETFSEPIASKEITLTKKPNEILEEYNEMQKKAGFDLSPYYGKTLEYYSYQIKDKTETYANIYIYNGKVIAADITNQITGEQRPIDEREEQG